MVDTGFYGDPVPAERLAVGYGPLSDGEINAPPYWGETSWLVMGSGGQVSTAGDTVRWLTAMRDGRILAPDRPSAFSVPAPALPATATPTGTRCFSIAPRWPSPTPFPHRCHRPWAGSGNRHPLRSRQPSGGDLLLEPYRPKFSLGRDGARA